MQQNDGCTNPIKITITNLEEGYEEMLVVENNPEDPSAGREMVFTKTVFIEREDFSDNPPKSF